MKIKNVRIKAKLTQSELAELSEVPIRIIRAFEQGSRNINKTNISCAIKLAYALNCKLEDILEDAENIYMLKNIYK